jgi:hypothetical protein
MRRATFFLLVFLCGSWSVSLGQHAPKFTTPRIVATFERFGLTAPMPLTTIYTPKSWGTFRISVVMVGTVANGTANPYWLGSLQITDGAGENSPCACDAFLFTQFRETSSGEFAIRAKAGKPIKFSVTAPLGGTSGSKYNVFVVVEQLM